MRLYSRFLFRKACLVLAGCEVSPFTSTHFEPIRDDGAVFNPYDVYQSTCVCQDGSSALNALFRDWRSLDFDIDMVVQLESIYINLLTY